MRAPEILDTELQRLGQFPTSKIFRQNNICMSAVVGSQYGALKEAAESLIVQLYSQGKLIRRDAKIEKLDPKTKF
jgi:hypothetical protein